MTLLPFLILLAAEGLLRAGGYGYDTRFLVPIEARAANTGNPRFGWRFFPRHLSRAPVMMSVSAPKPGDTFRIFVVGGSAAQGTPEPAYGFARILEVMLEEAYPDMKFEVINAAMTAINSHVVLPIVRDCAHHQPDLFILYLGNNEVVGPFGPGTVFNTFSPNRPWIHAGLRVRSWKIGQLLQATAERLRPKEAGSTGWRGMSMFLEQRVPASDPRLQNVYSHLERNLHDMYDAARTCGAGVIACTVAVNLSDTAPFASRHREGLDSRALEAWDKAYRAGIDLEREGRPGEALDLYAAAAEIDDRFADLHFRMARSAHALHDFPTARKHYLLARDMDALRFRADTSINRVIRESVSDRMDQGVILADVERVLGEGLTTYHGLPGEAFFYDHVHFAFPGNYAVARILFDRVSDLLPARLRAGAVKAPDLERCAARLGLTAREEFWMAEQIWQTTGLPPFTLRLDHFEWRARFFKSLREIERRFQRLDPTRAPAVHRQALKSAGDDIPARRGLARALHDSRSYDEAAEQWRRLLDRLPGNAELYLNLARTLLAKGDAVAAQREFDRALERASDAAEYCNLVGEAWFRHGLRDKAVEYYLQGLRLQPDRARLRSNLGSAYFAAREFEAARSEFQKAVRLNPSDPLVQANLGVCLFFCGQVEESAAQLKRAVELDPFSVEARNHFGFVLARQGRLAEAKEQFAAGLRLAPDHAELQERHRQVSDR
jgi:tetratricopeptide (TPR) repeat protein